MSSIWKVDEHGERYIDHGSGSRSYEMIVHTTHGNFPASQLRQQPSNKAPVSQKPDPRQCPFTGSTCTRDGCTMFYGSSCVISGTNTGATGTLGKSCPLGRRRRTCETTCALWNNGCQLLNKFLKMDGEKE